MTTSRLSAGTDAFLVPPARLTTSSCSSFESLDVKVTRSDSVPDEAGVLAAAVVVVVAGTEVVVLGAVVVVGGAVVVVVGAVVVEVVDAGAPAGSASDLPLPGDVWARAAVGSRGVRSETPTRTARNTELTARRGRPRHPASGPPAWSLSTEEWPAPPT